MDREKEYAKKYYQEHKEYFKEQQREWRKNNPKRWKELCKKNREKRVARLISEGVTNPYAVINKRAEAKYDDR